MAILDLALCFPPCFLETTLNNNIYMPETIRFSDVPHEKVQFVSLKALKQEFSRMVDAGNIKACESSSLTHTTARKLVKFWPK